ncbi:ROK family protein [Frankia sp. CiP3]|uniref:ROK family protein n=1 Tax=Frankia sp. CiP3 TaxID=2880971 RepID=UPI001EF71CA6|nr:ROK family protein [Frankia sp. CiP3]
MSESARESVTVFDVGGTHLRWAAWSPERGLGIVRRIPTPSRTNRPHATVDELRADLVAAMAAPVPRNGTAGVSFGAALNHGTGIVYASAPLWGADQRPFHLADALRTQRPDVRWHVVNDVTAALLHLVDSPDLGDRRKVLLATVSSGIACRTVDLRTGDIPVDGCGLQGEIGHLPAALTVDGEPMPLRCDCGKTGHLAAYSSGRGIRRLADALRARRADVWRRSALGTRLDGGEPFEHAWPAALGEACPAAGELLDAATRPMADVVRTALCLDPELDLVAFTGGVADGLGETYRTALLGHLAREGLYLTSERDPDWVVRRVTMCAEGQADGLVGAGLAAARAGVAR